MTDTNNLGSLSDALKESIERFALIADAMPQLVWVARPDGRFEYFNRRWSEYTGLTVESTNATYGASQGVVHPDDLAGMWERWSAALASGQSYECEYRLRRAATGVYRWFIARAAPVRDERGAVVRWVGTCTDVDEQRRAREGLAFTSRADEALFTSLDLKKAFAGLCSLIVSELADVAIVALADTDDGSLRPIATAHRDPESAKVLSAMCGQRILTPEGEQREWRRLREGRPRVIRNFDADAGRKQLWPYLASAIAPMQAKAAVTIPLQSRGATLGGLYVFYGDAACDPRDVPLLRDVARRASIAIENARSFERERRIAETFQRAALPLALARPQGLLVDAIFQPGSEEVEIGGDWYDTVLLRDNSLLIGIGDVMGRGLQAASIMARIRQMISVAALYEPDPSRILGTVDELIRQAVPDLIVTAFCGIIDPERKKLKYANAGHRPAFMRHRGRIVELKSTGLPLGVRHAGPSETATVALEGMEMLVLYTDGLVESRRTEGGEHEHRLRSAIMSDAVLHAHAPAKLILDACMLEDQTDDVAILTVRFDAPVGWTFTAENAQAANDARSDFVRYLRANAGDRKGIEAAELVFGELIGNVVRHAHGAIDVRFEWSDESALLHVIDRGPAFMLAGGLPSDVLSEGGRGLFIARQLAERLEVEHVGAYGNHVTAELRLRRSPGEVE